MPNLASFAFDDSLVRTRLDDDGRPWFVAKDVCAVLELEKYRDAISRLDEDERGSAIVDTPGGPQEMSIVSESGLYSLIFRSRKPEARRFRKWVTAEVLPGLALQPHPALFAAPQGRALGHIAQGRELLGVCFRLLR